MPEYDGDLRTFEANGAPALPAANNEGHIEHDGARIWYASYGSGQPVILLHGGFGNGGNWGYQLPALVAAGYRVILIDSRGHGRSTRDARPFTYELMASDVLAVMDALRLETAVLVGWSDGATIALIVARNHPARVAGVFFFAGNMDPGGVKEISQPNPLLIRMLSRHARDDARLSATPGEFGSFSAAVGHMMKTEPNYSAADVARISVPVTVAHSADDEFIKREHASYLAETIPGARFCDLQGVSHFAPLQRPDSFNSVLLAFLEDLTGRQARVQSPAGAVDRPRQPNEASAKPCEPRQRFV